MHFIFPHHIKYVYIVSKLHIISYCGSRLGLSEDGQNILFLVFIGSISFEKPVVQTELQQCPNWTALSLQNFPLSQSRNHIPVSCIKTLFILSFITERETDVWPTHVCLNMWRATSPSMDGDIIYSRLAHIPQILLPDERVVLRFC